MDTAQNKETVHKFVQDKFTTTTIRAARQIVVPLNNAALVLGTTTAPRLLLIQPHLQSYYRHKTLVALEIMKLPSDLPFYVTVTSFSDTPRNLPKHMVVAVPEPDPPAIPNYQHIPSNPVAIETSKKHKSRASSWKTTITDPNKPVRAVRYKAPVDWAKQMQRHADVQDEDIESLSHN